MFGFVFQPSMSFSHCKDEKLRSKTIKNNFPKVTQQSSVSASDVVWSGVGIGVWSQQPRKNAPDVLGAKWWFY